MKKYEYKFPSAIGYITFIMFGLMAWSSLSKAPHYSATIHIKHLIRFSPETSYYIWWGMSFFFLACALFGLYIIIQSFQLKQRFIMINENQISLPKRPISNTILNIPFRSINKIKFYQTSGIKQVVLFTEHEGKVIFTNKNLKSKADFDEICAILQEKINTSQK